MNFKLVIAALASLSMTACSTNQKSESQTELSCATFNVRYDTPVDLQNNWKYRKDSIAKFIKVHDIDVLGMQEVYHPMLKDLEQRLPEYKFIGVGKVDGKTEGAYNPVVFKKDRFELLDSNTFWLSQYPDSIGFIGWDGACTRIATWAKLKDKQNGKIFMVVNTHFDHVGVVARREGALLIMRRIQDIVGDRPAFLTGDFNVTDKSDAYTTLTTNKFVFKDAYKISTKKLGVSYTIHEFGKLPLEEREKIDFIFTTPQIKVGTSFIPKEPEGDSGFLSDHNPQITTLSF